MDPTPLNLAALTETREGVVFVVSVMSTTNPPGHDKVAAWHLSNPARCGELAARMVAAFLDRYEMGLTDSSPNPTALVLFSYHQRNGTTAPIMAVNFAGKATQVLHELPFDLHERCHTLAERHLRAVRGKS